MTEAKVRFNPGHLYQLRQIGILAEDESSIEQTELIKRALEKKKTIITVLENLQMEVGNKSQNILNFDLYYDWVGETIADLNLNDPTPEKLERLQEGVARMGGAIYWATVQIPLIEECSVALFNSAISKKLISKVNMKKAGKMINYIQDLRQKTGEIMSENGDKYIAAFGIAKKELIARGGTLPDIFEI